MELQIQSNLVWCQNWAHKIQSKLHAFCLPIGKHLQIIRLNPLQHPFNYKLRKKVPKNKLEFKPKKGKIKETMFLSLIARDKSLSITTSTQVSKLRTQLDWPVWSMKTPSRSRKCTWQRGDRTRNSIQTTILERKIPSPLRVHKWQN